VADQEALLARAREAAARAYAPYSNFRVGAAVLAGGSVYAACNVENASYSLTLCAERNAIFQAVAAGHRRIEAMALACVDATSGTEPGTAMPCGACRQVMAEFADPDMPVSVDRVRTFSLAELLPLPFRL